MGIVLIVVVGMAACLAIEESWGAPPSYDELLARAQQIAPLLPEQPTGLGRPIGDRAAWEAVGRVEAYRQMIGRAEALLTEPLPDQPDDLYLDYSRTGNRTRWQNVAGARRGRLAPLVIAECLEDHGRFLPAIEELVAALCSERTWVMPAHDGSLANFHGRAVDIDLASSALGWQLATTAYLLGDRLDLQTRALIDDNLARRVTEPFMGMISGRRGRNWWLTTTNNWNAVCLAGVAGTGLASVASREERAQLVAAAEAYSQFFLEGFTPDGYCSEGLGYWNYGFGHYVLLAETLHQATGGQVDLLARPQVRAPASFGARIEIVGGVSPAFADCSINARPDPVTMYFVNRRLGLGLRAYDELPPGAGLGSLPLAVMLAFPTSASRTPPVTQSAAGPGLREFFDSAGVLICRPQPNSPCRMGVALKGGHNAEHHNHNDVGSYVVVVGTQPVLLDPGSEVYTARTFSDRRYESKLLNSWGHPVPVVAGRLQRTGSDARARIVKTEFTAAADTLVLDITSAYEAPDLERLERTFTYSREGAGSLTVSDHVVFASPQSFGTALITLGQWDQSGPGTLTIQDGEEAVEVEVSCADGELVIRAEQILEDGPHPTRLGINLAQPMSEATVRVRIAPRDRPL